MRGSWLISWLVSWPVRWSPIVATIASAIAFLLVLFVPKAAHADVHLDGRWRQSALREDFTVQQWLDTRCGPPPQSTSTGGGEIINVRMEGDELAFIGGGRVYRTNQCYDPMPTLGRETHSRDAAGKTWRTRCTTAANDPRKAILNTLVVATTEAHIDLVETGRYEITLENGRCMADVKRTRTFDLLPEDIAPTPTATPTAKTLPKTPDRPTSAACGSPGEPTKLEVRPSKKLLRKGETFKFRPIVLDANGCDTRTATTWKVARDSEGKGVKVDGAGTVSVGTDAAEGTVDIVVTAAGKDAHVVVEVASAARYDELLALSGLNSAGENEEASTVAIASQSIGAGAGRVEDHSRERRLAFLAVIGLVLTALGLATIVLVRRTRRAKALMDQAEARHEERVQEVLDRRRRREAEHAAQMRAHQESVAAAKAAPSAKPSASSSSSEVFCSACRRDFSAGTVFCPHDGTRLVSSSEKENLPSAVGLVPRPGASRGKICPTCGDRFEGAADFCGKDGTQLVLIN